MTADVLAALLDPLHSAGLSVLAVDLPGQFESPGPHREQDYHPDPLGRTLAALVAELAADGDRVLLLGHSYGGLVSRSSVLAGAPVNGLTLLDSGPGGLPQGERRALLDATEPIMRAEGIEAVQRLREARDEIVEPPELAALLRARFLRFSTAGLLGMATGLRTEPDRVTELATALRTGGIPCLVAFGESDDAWPVPVQRDMAARLGAEVCGGDRCQTFAQYREPGRAARRTTADLAALAGGLTSCAAVGRCPSGSTDLSGEVCIRCGRATERNFCTRCVVGAPSPSAALHAWRSPTATS